MHQYPCTVVIGANKVILVSTRTTFLQTISTGASLTGIFPTHPICTIVFTLCLNERSMRPPKCNSNNGLQINDRQILS